MTLASTVREAARRFGDTTAFVAAQGWALSYTQLDRSSDAVAAALQRREVRPGDVVALVLPSTPDYVVAYAAIAKIGAVTTGVNPRFTPPERAAVVAAAKPALVLCTAELRDGLPPEVPAVVIAPATGPGQLAHMLGRPDYPDGPDGPDERDQPDQPDDPDERDRLATLVPLAETDDPEQIVTIVFTSGTTGAPKGAVFGNRELAAITAADVGDTWGGGGAMLASTQFAHIGFMTKLPWYLRLGTTTFLLDRWRARDVLQLIQDHRMTSVGGVAPQLALLLREPTFDEFDLSCVRTIIMGGALSPPTLVREARDRFGAAYSIRYSSTESGGIGTGTAFDADDEEALFTIGRPRGDVEIEVRDDDDRAVPDGTVGEICLRSSAMMRGYWHDPDATAATLRGGWLHTGDLGIIDAQGCLRLAGRRTDMFIRGGYNVHPNEVEAVIGLHPAVLDVAVIPRTDPLMGEIGLAVIVVRRGEAAPSLAELRSFAAGRLAAYKLPEAVEVALELPLTAMQKIDRAALRARFGAPIDHNGMHESG